ncbi:hypothetical protein ACOSQ2_026545 [Xanthoceras sorbifolium]
MSRSQPIDVDNLVTNPPQPQLPPLLLPAAPAPAPAPSPALDAARALVVAENSNFTRSPEQLMHKNRLQEYTQRSLIALPVYQTINEGFQHAPKFRSTVMVDGETYTSSNTFSHRKAAEQDVAKLALECISKKIKTEECPLIIEDTIFCKSILNEFAVKMNLERPTYNTIQPEGSLPVFISSLVFNGATYNGEVGKSKKEAEQLAARAVIRSLLGTSGFGTLLFEIIKSKVKMFAALRKVKDFHCGTQNNGVNTGHSSGNLVGHAIETAIVTHNVETPNVTHNVETPSVTHNVQTASVTHNVQTAANVAGNVQSSATPGKRLGMPLLHHQFKIPKAEPSSEPVNLPISFVPPVLEQPSGVGPSTSKKRRKNKKKANKSFPADVELPIVPQPFTQGQPLRLFM